MSNEKNVREVMDKFENKLQGISNQTRGPQMTETTKFLTFTHGITEPHRLGVHYLGELALSPTRRGYISLGIEAGYNSIDTTSMLCSDCCGTYAKGGGVCSGCGGEFLWGGEPLQNAGFAVLRSTDSEDTLYNRLRYLWNDLGVNEYDGILYSALFIEEFRKQSEWCRKWLNGVGGESTEVVPYPIPLDYTPRFTSDADDSDFHLVLKGLYHAQDDKVAELDAVVPLSHVG